MNNPITPGKLPFFGFVTLFVDTCMLRFFKK